MLTPGAVVLTGPAAAQAPETAGTPALPDGVREALAAWLLKGESKADVPRTASGLLGALGGQALAGPSPSGWDAYFAAFGLRPTSAESDALRDFQLLHPHLSLEIESLAADVARAQAMRDEAFSALTDAQWALLPDAVSLLAAGQPGLLGADHLAALAAVDGARLVDAAMLLSRTSEDAPARLARAQALDAALDASVPLAVREGAALGDPAAIVRAIAAGAPPVQTDLSLEQVLAGLSLLSGSTGTRSNARLLPADLQAPLAAMLVAHSRERAGLPGSGLASLATIADQLPALTRAAYNLSLASPGSIATLNHQQRALETLSGAHFGAPLRVIQDLYGVSAAPPRATLVEGLTRLADAMGAPLTPEELARARASEAHMGPAFSGALGAVLAAQADYARAVSAESMAPSLALHEATLPILSSGGPLTGGDIETLRRSAGAQQERRESVGAAASALAYAVLDLPGKSAPTSAMAAETADATEMGPLLILNDQSSLVDRDRFAGPYVLVVDLGGDDTYRIPLAGVSGPAGVSAQPGPSEARSAVAIDLGGNDHYEAVEDVSLGAAQGTPIAPAFAFLLDVRGNDAYVGRSIAGYGSDGVGILVDVQGDDRYDAAVAGLAHATTTGITSIAAGVLMDGIGNDRYDTQSGFAHLGEPSPTVATAAMFLDVGGSDEYVIPCLRDETVACFATPRPANETAAARGAVVFIDAGGVNRYPRPSDPRASTEEMDSNVQGAQRALGNATSGDEVDLSDVDAGRYAFVSDSASVHEALADALGGAIDTYDLVRDDDGDLIPSSVEETFGFREDDPTNPIGSTEDGDGDGFNDLVEEILGTRSDDPGSYPVGVPAMPTGVDDPGLLPAGPANLIVNLPGVVAIGGPGPTRYESPYTFSIDLGFGAPDATSSTDLTGGSREGDIYLDAVAQNGHAIDLDGDDRYAPAGRDGMAAPAGLAAILGEGSGLAAALIDLNGRDSYTAPERSLAHAGRPQSVALFLDAGAGDDVYRAQGQSMAYAGSGGSAYFLDLGGDDKYTAPTQAYVGRPGGEPGLVALFLDAEGNDQYDAGVDPVSPAMVDMNQGRVQPVTRGIITQDEVGEAPVAAFLDLGGKDRYYVMDAITSARTDMAAQKEHRLRIDPLHGGTPSGLSVFYDTTTADGDGDLHPDASEDAAGSDPGESQEAPIGTSVQGSYLLALPRLGLVVGGASENTYLPLGEFALQVDLGSRDHYLNRAGASSLRFPTSLLVDSGGDDVYSFEGGHNITDIASFRLSRNAFGSGAKTINDVPAFIGAAQGAGILGVGVLRDDGGDNAFTLRVARGCEECNVVSLGLGQGAGLLGVGVLSVGEASAAANDNTFLAEVEATAEKGVTAALTHAQGAGLLGVGILAAESARGQDGYEVRARTAPSGNFNVTTGQGYGFAGTGVLLDAGGDNVLRAERLAQGAADGFLFTPTPMRVPTPFDVIDGVLAGLTTVKTSPLNTFYPDRSIGQLLLPGVGDDQLFAANMSQGFGVGTYGLGLVLDTEGDDTRTLAPNLDVTDAGLGQGAGVHSGIGVLLDNRGNDVYIALGEGAQGYGSMGTGILADLSGADVYEAFDYAQGTVSDRHFATHPVSQRQAPPQGTAAAQVKASAPSVAVFLDRMGNDIYATLSDARAQGSAHYTSAVAVTLSGDGVVETEHHYGTAFFVDAGGFDSYSPDPNSDEKPVGRFPVEGQPFTQAGNDWVWTVNDTVVPGGSAYVGVGIDNGTITGSFASVTTRLGEDRLEVSCAEPCKGLVPLKASLGASSVRSGAQIDRVEFYDTSKYLGLGAVSGSTTDQSFTFELETDALDAEGIPLHPDGERDLQAMIYLRTGTPDAQGRRVAVDAEPVIAQQTLKVDNPPIARGAGLPGTNITTRQGPVPLDLRVDRDLERCASACPALRLGHFGPGPDEWALPANMGIEGTSTHDPACGSGCVPSITVKSGGGRAYLTWTDPSGIDAKGFRVVRVTSEGASTIGYVDARLPTRDDRFWFVDATGAASATQYRVEPIYVGSEGTLRHASASATYAHKASLPGPAAGLRALGVEGAIHLAWREAAGATGYTLTRTPAFGTPPPTLTTTAWTDTDVRPDLRYNYTVVALAGAAEGEVPSLNVSARAAPGHTVDVLLQSGLDRAGGVAILPPSDFGGGQTHRLTWDASAVPDGQYHVNTTWTDGAGVTTYNLTRVTLDGTAPRTTLDLPANAGGALLSGSTLRIPFRVDEGGSGLKRTAFWFRVDDEPWSAVPVVVGPNATEVTFNGARDGMRLAIVAASEDNVGNVERIPANRGWPNTLPEGFQVALAANAFTQHVLDVSAPLGKFTRVDHVARPGQAIDFSLDITDAGTGISSVVASIRDERVPLFPAGDKVWSGRWIVQGPDGLVQILVELRDNAGNVATLSLGSVTVDATPPVVADATLVFPGGRLVGRPGETATLRVAASDPFVLEGELNVTLDASNVSSTNQTFLRYDADARVYTASFPVNRMLGKEANVTLDVLDTARNLNRVIVPVRLNTSATSLAIPVVTTGADHALVNWTTPDAVRSRVDYGLSPQLGSSTTTGPVTRAHSVAITGLKPDTDYYAFAVGITDAGIESRSDLVAFRTGPAITLALQPVAGLPHSTGDARVALDVRRYDGVPAEVDAEAWLNAPRGTPRLVASATGLRAGDALDLDLSGVRDGNYSLVVKVRQGEMRGENLPQVLVVDRQAPMIGLSEARAVTKGATFSLQVDERGSGIDVAQVVWTFNGRRCSARLADDALSCTVPDLRADASEVTMLLEVPDRAGNLAKLEMRLGVDSAAPVLSGHALGGLDGSAHLRPGAKGVLRVDVKDLSVKLVEADLSAVGGAKATPMARVGDARYEAAFDVPATLREGPVTVLVRAIDAADQIAVITVTSVVDATAPGLRRGAIVPQAPGEVMVVIEGDEPTLARVKAAGPFGEVSASSEGVQQEHTLRLRGLRAGTPLRVAVTLVDNAGHETTRLLDGQALADRSPPAKVPNLRVEDRGDGRVVLRWDAAQDDDGIAHYRVIRSIPGQTSVTLPPVAGLLATDAVPVGVTVGYTVAAVDHGGNAGEVASGQVVSASVPVLAEGLVDPPTGGPGLFTFTVLVTDASGKAPEVSVRVDGVSHPMKADKADCRGGCRYSAVVLVGAETLAGGPHAYSFHVSSGSFRVSYPETDPLLGPTVLQGEDAPLVGVLAAANRVPTGGILLAALAVAGAVVAAILLRRRKA